MRLIHLTDPHLSSLAGQSFVSLRGKRRSGYLSWKRNRRHVHRREILDALTEELLRHRPDQILLTGDLVHIGLESEMVEAAEWLSRLGPPEKVLFVPGNHDNYAGDSLLYMSRHWAGYLPAGYPAGGDYTSGFPIVREQAGLKLIGVNTSCVTRIFSARGELGERQMHQLTRVLEKKSGSADFNCLLIHHPPFPGMTRRRKALRDAAKLLETASRCSPDLVLYGHIHCNREDHRRGIRSYCTASASSAENASFRIIDLEREESGWNCRMRLMRLENEALPKVSFALAEDALWRTF